MTDSMDLPTKSICLGTDLPAVPVPQHTAQSTSTYQDTYPNSAYDAPGPTEHMHPKMTLIGLLATKI